MTVAKSVECVDSNKKGEMSHQDVIRQHSSETLAPTCTWRLSSSRTPGEHDVRSLQDTAQTNDTEHAAPGSSASGRERRNRKLGSWRLSHSCKWESYLSTQQQIKIYERTKHWKNSFLKQRSFFLKHAMKQCQYFSQNTRFVCLLQALSYNLQIHVFFGEPLTNVNKLLASPLLAIGA